jgi:U4/U6 small nuclear ribonucleoprotein PRP31
MAVSEAYKNQNRMKFGEAEEEILDGDTFEGMGLLGGETGKIRVSENKRKSTYIPYYLFPIEICDYCMIVGLSKKHKSFSTNSSNTSGLASSVLSFTPVQGIELENPEAAAQRRAAAASDDKYFGGKFLVPSLPNKK